MKYYEAFSKITGDAAPQYFTSVEQAAQFVVDNFGEEALSEFDLREANQVQEREQATKQAQQQVMQEERADESTPEIIAKNIVRMILPYSAEEAETKGQNTSSGMMRDIANIGMILSNPASIPAKFALGGALTAADIGAQKEYQGDIDPTRTATVGALSQAPVIAQGASKISGVQAVGDWLTGRSKGQALSSFVGNKNARMGKNPITEEKVEEWILKKNRIPIFSREKPALEKASNALQDDINQMMRARNEVAKDVTDRIPVYYRKFPEKSHIEAVPSDEFIAAQQNARLDEMNINNPKKAAYTKAMNRWERDPYATFMERPEEPTYQSVSVSPAIDEWVLQKVVEQPEKITRGAYENAKRRVMVDYKSDKEAGQVILDNIDSWYNAQAPKSGDVSAYKASNMVSEINDIANTFNKTKGATTPYELSRAYIADAINAEITKASPDMRGITKDIGRAVAVARPLQERVTANAVAAGSRSGIRNELSAFIHKSPQSAQAQYNLGQMFTQGSPILREAVKYSQSLSAPIGTMIPFKRE